jgi:hypothetical protein
MKRGLARGTLSQAGGDNVTHDALVYHCRVDARALERSTHHQRTQLHSRKTGE